MCSSGVKETRACVLVETMEGICDPLQENLM